MVYNIMLVLFFFLFWLRGKYFCGILSSSSAAAAAAAVCKRGGGRGKQMVPSIDGCQWGGGDYEKKIRSATEYEIMTKKWFIL